MGFDTLRQGAALLAMAALALSGCADVPPPPPAAAPVAAAPTPAPASPSGIVLGPQQQGTTLANDPSAPLDTPLCGIQARENNTMGQALLAQQYARAGICSSFACYDPATATYLGADGYRHVCR